MPNKDGNITQESFKNVQYPAFAVDREQPNPPLPNDMLTTKSQPWGLYIDSKSESGKIGCILLHKGQTAPFDAAKGNYACPASPPFVNVPGAIDGSNMLHFNYQGPEVSQAIDIDKTQPQWTIKFFDKAKNQYSTVPVLKAWF
ncbi:hypothetical protein [Paenarthrobacter sp. 4246]|uniref:hypothetical protein n=1 Tax=Paenarthrobacter sp. 4246 TaxID=3156456 RepID=UPI003397905A